MYIHPRILYVRHDAVLRLVMRPSSALSPENNRIIGAYRFTEPVGTYGFTYTPCGVHSSDTRSSKGSTILYWQLWRGTMDEIE